MPERRMKFAVYLMMTIALIVVCALLIEHLSSTLTFFDAIPSIFIFALIAAFLVDSIYFIEYIDFSRTLFELAMDFVLMLLLVILSENAYVPENVPVVFIILAITFMIAIMKYWIAAKRHNKKDVQNFIKKKATIDIIGMFSFFILAAISFFFSFIAPYLILGTGLFFIGFLLYLLVDPKYFSIKNKVI